MSTEVSIRDSDLFNQTLAEVRSDSHNRTWLIVGHVDNKPNSIDVVAMDTADQETPDNFRSHLQDDQVMYCFLRLSTTIDLSTTVKFVYIHWIGEGVPFVKKGRFGVVYGSVEKYFDPYHVGLETGTKDDLTEEELIQKLEESSGTKNKIVEGPLEGRQMRTFIGSHGPSSGKSEPRSIAPGASGIEVSAELEQAVSDVRGDEADTNWLVAGFDGGDPRKELILVATGCGDISTLTDHLLDDQVMYALYRTKDVIDDIVTVKFVSINWTGDRTKPLIKGKVTTKTGAVEKALGETHVSLFFTSRYDINESVIQDKVTSSSGSKSHVQ